MNRMWPAASSSWCLEKSFLPEFAFVWASYHVNSKRKKKTVISHMHECGTWGQAQASKKKKTWWIFVKPVRGKTGRWWNLPESQGLQTRSFFMHFFPPAKTLKFRSASNYLKTQPIPELSLEFFQGFCQKFLSKEFQERPSLSINDEGEPSSWFMRNCEDTFKYCAVNMVSVAKKVWPTSLAPFWMEKGKKWESNQQRDRGGSQCLVFLLCPGKEVSTENYLRP